MGCGAPCVTSNGSSLAELVADGAEQVDPQDVDALGEVMMALWKDEPPLAALAARGLLRARAFDDERAIEALFTVYRSLLSAGPRGAAERSALSRS
jgi:glycosyltransferase involved in cell wall biosynthesis